MLCQPPRKNLRPSDVESPMQKHEKQNTKKKGSIAYDFHFPNEAIQPDSRWIPKNFQLFDLLNI